MRILHICTSFFAGGIQRHAMELGDSLRAKGHEVALAGDTGPWLDANTPLNFLPLDLLKVSKDDSHSSVPARIWHALKCALKLRPFLKEHRIELIHAHESAPVIVAKLASLGLNIPIVLTFHGSAPDRVKSFGLIGRATATLMITPSANCAEELIEQAGVPRNKIDVIGLGVEPPPTIDAARVNQHRIQLLEPDGEYLVVMIARLAYQKGIDVLVDVVRRVVEQRQDIRFVVIGDGPEKAAAMQWIADAGIEKYLRLDGESNEPYLYLKAADLFLLTSRWEALPITIAEAFQAGLPVVATNTGGVEELVAPAVGHVTAVGDAAAISRSILEIIGDPELRRTMSAAANRLSQEDRFSLPHIHSVFERTYANILGVKL
jgi:glycosyltransferase involved in cell wall biosynthesis